MKYVKTFEELDWFKRFKTPKQVVTSIVEEDKNQKLNKKIAEAIIELDLQGVRFHTDNIKQDPIPITRKYKSHVDLQIPIEGYSSSILIFDRNATKIVLELKMVFDIKSKTYDITKKRGQTGIGSPYIFFGNGIISTSISHDIDYEWKVIDIQRIVSTMIKDIIKVDVERLKKDIDKLKSDKEEKDRIKGEYLNKLANLKNRMDEISDYLVGLEDISSKHTKEFNDNLQRDAGIILTYDIPGIKVNGSDSSAILYINDTMVKVMDTIKSFTKRAEKEIKECEVIYWFKENKLIIKLSIENPFTIRKRIGILPPDPD